MNKEINIELAIKYLTNSLIDEEKAAFEYWLSESEENRRQFDHYKHYWESTEKVFDNYMPDKSRAWNNIQSRTKQQTKHISFYSSRMLKIAASIIIILGLGASMFYFFSAGKYSSRGTISYYSGDSISKIQLADGSEVWLNKNSELQAPTKFSTKNRMVFLRGEGFFEVKKNPNRPFLVVTKNTVTKVLGTSFSISTNTIDDNVIIIVATGKVSFFEKNNEKNEIKLLPGDKGIYIADNESISKGINLNSNFISWKTKELIFNNTPLLEVCQILEKQYNIQFIINEQKAKKYTLTGKFTDAQLTEILKITGETLSINFILCNNSYKVEFKDKN